MNINSPPPRLIGVGHFGDINIRFKTMFTRYHTVQTLTQCGRNTTGGIGPTC